MKRATISQLAAAAGVSVATVNRAMSGRAEVRPETIKHVLAVAEEIGFYGTGTIRSRLKTDRPQRTFGWILQQQSMPFHRDLAHLFKARAAERGDIRITPIIEHVQDLDPVIVAQKLDELGRECDAIALTYADHPAVNQVVESLTKSGTPVFAAVSDLSATGKAGYVGIDNRRFGRAAAWYADHLETRGTEVGILMGTHRHVCQEQREMGFRSYLREHARDLKVLEPITTYESDLGAYDATADLLRRHKELHAIYVTGGGIRGAIRALREQPKGKLPYLLSCEFSEEMRGDLIEGVMTVALVHPMQDMVDALLDTMALATNNEDVTRTDQILPYEIVFSENV